MTVIIINPNSTETMTEAMVEVASREVPSLNFEGWTSHKGPPSIQGEEDGLLATPPFLELVAKASDQGADAIIIGCFDDTALSEAAKIANCPVIGIGQASYHYAALRNWRFSVVTTLAASVPVLEKNIASYGLKEHVAKVRASDVPVLDLEKDPEAAKLKILSEAHEAQEDDRVSAIVLGCAGMVQVFDEVQRSLSVAVIDPVVCAANCCVWLMRLESTSRANDIGF